MRVRLPHLAKVEVAHRSSLPQNLTRILHGKNVGYLTCYLLLHEGNELNIMLVNTLQKACLLLSKPLLTVSLRQANIHKRVQDKELPDGLAIVESRLIQFSSVPSTQHTSAHHRI